MQKTTITTKKNPIHPNSVTESQKRGGTKRLTIVTHITANSDPVQNLGALGSIASYFWRLFTRNIFSPLLPTYLQQQYSIPLEKIGSPGSIRASRGLSSNETTNIPHSPPLTHERQKHHPSPTTSPLLSSHHPPPTSPLLPQPRHY